MDKEQVERLFAGACDFVLAASEPEHFSSVPGSLSEVAFIGRSNVGKSSLINAMTNRKGLARASNTPGRTQQIIFFNLADRLMLVDLPGYGFASAPDQEVKAWTGLVRHYLKARVELKLVVLLVDGRHGVLAKDTDMMDFLDKQAVSYQVVLTKGDLVKGNDKEQKLRQTEAIMAKHPAARPSPLFVSAEKGDNISPLRELVCKVAFV